MSAIRDVRDNSGASECRVAVDRRCSDCADRLRIPYGEGMLTRHSGRCNGRAVTNKIATLVNSAEERAVQRESIGSFPRPHGFGRAAALSYGVLLPTVMPIMKKIRQATRKIKNRSLAIPAAATAMPVNPNTAATNAITKKITAQRNIFSPLPFRLAVRVARRSYDEVSVCAALLYSCVAFGISASRS
jgi:hypothetical protein